MLKPWVVAGRGVEHCRELLELVGIQAEEHLIKYYRLRFVADSLGLEVRSLPYGTKAITIRLTAGLLAST